MASSLSGLRAHAGRIKERTGAEERKVSAWLNKKSLLIFGLHVAVVVIGITVFLCFYRKNNKVLRIVKYPHPVLREISEPIGHIDNHVVSLSNAMVATLRYRTMVDFFVDRSTPRGLAAPQVGMAMRLIVCGLNGEVKVMVNPEILERKGTFSTHDDCLSVLKGDNKILKRSAYIKVGYKDLDNIARTLTARNHDAALLEHEIDHLNGVLNIDYWADEHTLSSAAY
jgi:peptide deformylase